MKKFFLFLTLFSLICLSGFQKTLVADGVRNTKEEKFVWNNSITHFCLTRPDHTLYGVDRYRSLSYYADTFTIEINLKASVSELQVYYFSSGVAFRIEDRFDSLYNNVSLNLPNFKGRDLISHDVEYLDAIQTCNDPEAVRLLHIAMASSMPRK